LVDENVVCSILENNFAFCSSDSYDLFSTFRVGIGCFVFLPLIVLIRFQKGFVLGGFVPNLSTKHFHSLSLVDLFSSRIITVNLLYNFFDVEQFGSFLDNFRAILRAFIKSKICSGSCFCFL
jgi:hypothetical protein